MYKIAEPDSLEWAVRCLEDHIDGWVLMNTQDMRRILRAIKEVMPDAGSRRKRETHKKKPR